MSSELVSPMIGKEGYGLGLQIMLLYPSPMELALRVAYTQQPPLEAAPHTAPLFQCGPGISRLPHFRCLILDQFLNLLGFASLSANRHAD